MVLNPMGCSQFATRLRMNFCEALRWIKGGGLTRAIRQSPLMN